MRKQDFDSALEALPTGIARFDRDGIPDAVNHINSAGLLTPFVDAIKSGPSGVVAVINQVFTVPASQQAFLNDLQKVEQAFVQTIQTIASNPSPAQVINAIVNFFGKLF